MTIKDLFSFEKMVTPVIIKILYLLGLIGGLVFVIISVISGLEANDYGYMYDTSIMSPGNLGIVGSIFLYVVFAFVWRLFLEAVIVIFQIYRNLNESAEILRSLKQSAGGKP